MNKRALYILGSILVLTLASACSKKGSKSSAAPPAPVDPAAGGSVTGSAGKWSGNLEIVKPEGLRAAMRDANKCHQGSCNLDAAKLGVIIFENKLPSKAYFQISTYKNGYKRATLKDYVLADLKADKSAIVLAFPIFKHPQYPNYPQWPQPRQPRCWWVPYKSYGGGNNVHVSGYFSINGIWIGGQYNGGGGQQQAGGYLECEENDYQIQHASGEYESQGFYHGGGGGGGFQNQVNPELFQIEFTYKDAECTALLVKVLYKGTEVAKGELAKH